MTTPDWADEEASRFLETQDMPMNTRDVDRIVLVAALRKAKAMPMNTRDVDRIVLAAALRKAKAAGMREAAEMVLNVDYWQIDHGQPAEGKIFSGVTTIDNRDRNHESLAAAIRAAASKLEKGEA